MSGHIVPTGPAGRSVGADLSKKEQERLDEARSAFAVRCNETREIIGKVANFTDCAIPTLTTLKGSESTLESLVPDAAEWINLAANIGAMSVICRLAEYEGQSSTSLMDWIDGSRAGGAAVAGSFWALRHKRRAKKRLQDEQRQRETPEQTLSRHIDEEARRTQEARLRAAAEGWPR